MRLLSFLLSNLGKKRRAADSDKTNEAAVSGSSKAAVPWDKKPERWSWASLRIRRGGRLAKRGNGDGVADETRAVDGKGVRENHGSTGTGVPEMGMGDESTAPTSAHESAHEIRDKKRRRDETVDVEIGVDAEVEPRNNGRNHSIAPAHALEPALVSTFPLLPARA
jgi:hypothetical protein